MTGPWDAGLQPERTELAWRRTVLTVTGGTMIAARYVGIAHPHLGVVLPLVALLGGLALLHVVTLRFDQLAAALRATPSQSGQPAIGGGIMIATLASVSLLIALASGAFVAATFRAE